MRRTGLVLGLILVLTLTLYQCNSPEEKPEVSDLIWLNHHDTVSYVGMDACSGCHGDVRHTFVHTGMGKSFDHATPGKAFFDWDGSEVIVDPHSGYSYQPYFVDSTLFVLEFRTEGGDTVHKRRQRVDYIIGSGQHTNSHIWNSNGFLYQAPFTYYTQEGRADLPPGFENGNNTRFTRIIGLECMSCHNAMPTEFVLGSNNRFNAVPTGINCERCHGPGELHVAEKLAGNIVDTSQGPDYTIVNPRRLSADLQMELCQRCHLQGNAVLAEGKSFFDFRPGMRLSEVMDVYLPRYDNSEHSFIMASHADRLKLSDCYKAGDGSFNCISCHNPHVSIAETNTLQFNKTCNSCHTSEKSNLCTESELERSKVDDNCVQCHMPSSSSEDIPHVSVHDHWIKVPDAGVEIQIEDQVERTLLALVAINNSQPSNRSKARAFLQQYEQFGGEVSLLDSAWTYIRELEDSAAITELVHLYHLRGTSGLLVQEVERRGPQIVLGQLNQQTYDNRHAWTAYRIGEAYNSVNQADFARMFYRKAVALAPDVLEIRNKLGAVSLKLGDVEEAEKQFKYIIDLNPYLTDANSNYGYVQLIYGDTTIALEYFEYALNLDPDYEPARLNAVSAYYALGRYDEAKRALKPLIEAYPNNQQYLAVWEDINRKE